MAEFRRWGTIVLSSVVGDVVFCLVVFLSFVLWSFVICNVVFVLLSFFWWPFRLLSFFFRRAGPALSFVFFSAVHD